MIRKCKKADLPQMHELVRELAIFEKEPDAVLTTVAEYEKAFDQGLIDAFVAEINDEIVGMSFFYPIFSTWNGRTLYLEDFIVKQNARNLGLGQQLFDAFLQEARNQGCRQVKWQVLDWNEDAIRFYERNGASIEKNWWNGRMVLSKIVE